MKNLLFENVDALVTDVLNTWDKEKNTDKEFLSVSIVAGYDVAITFLNRIIKKPGTKMSNVKIEHPDINGYKREWIVTVAYDGEVWVQEAYFDGSGYIGSDTDEIIYVHGDVNSKYVQKNYDSRLIEFDFCDDEFDDYMDASTKNGNKAMMTYLNLIKTILI